MFTEADIKRARLIVKKIPELKKAAGFLDAQAFGGAPKAVAGGFGRLEGNPNTMDMAWPKYNAPPPAFSAQKGPLTFMQSVGNMARGAGRSGMGLATAATIGQNGSNGMLGNVLVRGAQSAGDYGRGYYHAGRALLRGQGWRGAGQALTRDTSNTGNRWTGAISGPMARFRYNNSEDINNLKSPATWFKQPWLPEWRGYGGN
jgi:hypothetical protein